MNSRYFAKVVKVVDKFTVVINAGSDNGIKNGQTFLIVGVGEVIQDPDTGESLGALEILRGKARVVHVQERLSTLVSAELEKKPDVKEIKKVSAGGRPTSLMGILTAQETVTESIKPSEPQIKALTDVAPGDRVIVV